MRWFISGMAKAGEKLLVLLDIDPVLRAWIWRHPAARTERITRSMAVWRSGWRRAIIQDPPESGFEQGGSRRRMAWDSR